MVTLPVQANFHAWRDYSKEEEGPIHCTEEPFVAVNYQVREGEAT